MKRFLSFVSFSAFIFLFPFFIFASMMQEEIDPYNQFLTRSTNTKIKEVLTKLQEDIDYKFKDIKLLELALRRNNLDFGHSQASLGYDRLAFLGDKLLKFFVVEKLWREYHYFPAKIAKKYSPKFLENATFGDLNRELKLTQRAFQAGLSHAPQLNSHDQGDHVESLFGALYYDGGLIACQKFFRKYFSETSISPVIQSLFLEIKQHYQQLRPSKIPKLEENQAWDSFLGEVLLNLSLSDFLCARYPLYSKGRLTTLFIELFNNESKANLVKTFFQGHTLKDFLSLLANIYSNSGSYLGIYNFVIWLYSGPKVPIEISNSLIKTPSDGEGIIYTENPSIAIGVGPKSILDQILLLSEKKAVYRRIRKTGPDHAPFFEATIHCENLFHVTAFDKTKTTAQGLAALKALRQMASTFLKNLPDHPSKTALSILEWTLADLGYKDFNYFSLGKFSQGKEKFFRYEVQGPGITPISGEGHSPEEAKASALKACIYNLLQLSNDSTTEDIYSTLEEHDMSNKKLIAYRDPLNLLLQISALLNLQFETNWTQGGADHAPIFLYKIKGPKIEGRGEGKTKSEAKKKAAIMALNCLRAKAESFMDKKEWSIFEKKGLSFLELIDLWNLKNNECLEKAIQLQSPKALEHLALKIYWRLNLKNDQVRLIASKSGKKTQVELKINNENTFLGIGLNTVRAFLTAIRQNSTKKSYL